MQIFFKITNKGNRTYTLDVTPEMTFDDLVVAAMQKANGPVDKFDNLRITRKGLPLRAQRQHTVSDHNLQKEETLHFTFVQSQESQVNQEVAKQLGLFLSSCAKQANDNEITFIGIGCYDNGHGGSAREKEDSIRRQQCPDALFRYCVENQIDLNVILIDPGFESTEGPPQVFDLGGWVLMSEMLGGKIRRYKNAEATRLSSCDIWITVFATRILEYGTELQKNGTEICGFKIREAFQAMLDKQPGLFLACGNFYGEPTETSQYFTLGDQTKKAGSGFNNQEYYKQNR